MFVSTSAYSLVIQADRAGCKENECWQIIGAITGADVPRVAAIARSTAVSGRRPTFFLDSAGGEVEAAITIGRHLRRMLAHVFVTEGRCLSSCVFIYAGAVHRVGFRIGIHRPFSLITGVRSYDEMQLEQRRLTAMAKAFLEEMNVSPRLLEAMMVVPPESMRMLSNSELEEFGLGTMDSVHQARQDAEAADELGLSMQEFLRRKARAEAICRRMLDETRNIATYLDCRDKVLRGRM